jgi:hypothetical protein
MRIYRICFDLPTGNVVFTLRALTRSQAEKQAKELLNERPGVYRTPNRTIVTDLSDRAVV